MWGEKDAVQAAFGQPGGDFRPLRPGVQQGLAGGEAVQVGNSASRKNQRQALVCGDNLYQPGTAAALVISEQFCQRGGGDMVGLGACLAEEDIHGIREILPLCATLVPKPVKVLQPAFSVWVKST